MIPFLQLDVNLILEYTMPTKKENSLDYEQREGKYFSFFLYLIGLITTEFAPVFKTAAFLYLYLNIEILKKKKKKKKNKKE